MRLDRQRMVRDVTKLLIGGLVRWRPLAEPRPGYSIVLGTPWALRHLLRANLLFVSRLDLAQLDQVYVVFDRRAQSGASAFAESVRVEFPRLPLHFEFHPPFLGRILERVNQSKFYASTNWVLGLRRCRTRYAILHDFDLYPTQADFFSRIVQAMREKRLRFAGPEYTHFDGLTDEDGLLGTWELGLDVEWLRNTYRPIQCYHSVAEVNGRRVDLDAFSRIQSMTPQRRLAEGVGRDSYAHVTNLCSTYLRLTSGSPVNITWRIPFLWYLEALSSRIDSLERITNEMRHSISGRLTVDNLMLDFSGVHVTCSNVLRDELHRMEAALYGGCRPLVAAYIDAFEEFLKRHGSHDQACRSDPTVAQRVDPLAIRTSVPPARHVG